jgi:hypothetical protein
MVCQLGQAADLIGTSVGEPLHCGWNNTGLVNDADRVHRRSRLGGLLKFYSLAA